MHDLKLLPDIYRLALCLYPRRYREIFRDEMLAVFAAAWTEVSSQSMLSRIRFAMRESIGVIAGAAIEHRRLLNLRQVTPVRETPRFSVKFVYRMVLLFCLVLAAIAASARFALHSAGQSHPVLHESMYALPAMIPMLLVVYEVGAILSLAKSYLRAD